MAKKKKTYTREVVIPLIVTGMLILMFFTLKPSITGKIPKEGKVILDGTYSLNDLVTIIPVEKEPNSALEITASSVPETIVYVETDDCPLWENQMDDTALLKQIVAENTKFKVGDVLENTKQQMLLYETGKLCLIVVNQKGAEEINIFVDQVEKGLWKIVH